MTENKRFVNKGKDILQYGEWWCSAGGEHCADVIATALNEQQKIIRDMKFLISNLESQRDEFHRGARENANLVGKLKKENGQLKEKKQHLLNIINCLEAGSCRSIDSFLDSYCSDELLREYNLE